MHTHAVPVLQWISQLVGNTSGEEPPGSSSPALGSATPLTAHLQCHPEIAVAAVGMCKLCRCIDCWHRLASFPLLTINKKMKLNINQRNHMTISQSILKLH